MTDYFTLERADILNQLNQMGKENKIDQMLLKKNINELYRIFHTIAAPKTGKREETKKFLLTICLYFFHFILKKC